MAIQITRNQLKKLIREGVMALHNENKDELNKEITVTREQLKKMIREGVIALSREKASLIKEEVMADKDYTHFAIYKPTGQIMNAWNYADEDPEDLKLEANLYFMQDIRDMFPGYGIKAKDVSIINRRNLDKRGIDPENINNWYRPWENKDGIEEDKEYYTDESGQEVYRDHLGNVLPKSENFWGTWITADGRELKGFVNDEGQFVIQLGQTGLFPYNDEKIAYKKFDQLIKDLSAEEME